jgi:hypothetical protein
MTAARALGPWARPVSLFASALAGRALALQLAPGNEQAAAVTLAPALLSGIEPGGRWGALRIEVLRHVVQLQPGGRWQFDLGEAAARGLIGPRELPMQGDALQHCLQTWPRPVLLRRLFLAIDAVRVEACIARQFPGVRAELQALERLGPADRLRRSLPRRLLGNGDARTRWPLLADAWHADASVYDSLRAAIGLAALLAWGRPRGAAALPRWLHIEAPEAGPGEPQAEDGFADASPQDSAAGFLVRALRHARVRVEAQAPVSRSAPRPGRVARQTQAPIEGRLPHDAPVRPACTSRARHDEWHYGEQRYLRAWTQVHEHRLQGEDLQFLAQLRRRHAGLAAGIRRRIGKVRPQGRLRLRRQSEGDEIDFDAAVVERAERLAGHGGDARVYTALQPARREVCAAFLLDISGSTGFLVPDISPSLAAEPEPADDDPYFYASPRRSLPPQPARRRVIDVAKDAIGLMCDVLAGLGDRHAVYGFSGDGREQVDFYLAKGFDEAWSTQAAAALARMEPKGSTRTGAALRHAAHKLARQPEHLRLLIVVTDGYPQDSDYGPDPQDVEYGLRDTAQAMKEAERAGIAVFFVSVDHAAHDYLRRLCPASRYLVIDEVGGLPEQLAKVYRSLVSCRGR